MLSFNLIFRYLYLMPLSYQELSVAHCLSSEVINSGTLQSSQVQNLSFLAVDIYAKLVFSILKVGVYEF